MGNTVKTPHPGINTTYDADLEHVRRLKARLEKDGSLDSTIKSTLMLACDLLIATLYIRENATEMKRMLVAKVAGLAAQMIGL